MHSGAAGDDAISSGKTELRVVAEKPDQWLATKFEGMDVLGSDNEKIGDVSDILFDKTGKVDAFIISVGGFLLASVRRKLRLRQFFRRGAWCARRFVP